MDRKSRRSVAVTAGLAAVLALSPVVAPAVTALAQDGDSTASTQAAEKVTVTFEFGRGHDSVTKECEVNGQVDYPKPYPYEEDYTIEGWYYDEALTQKWYAGDHMSEDTTLYAKWVQRYCTFTFWNASSYDDMSALSPYYRQTVTYGTNGELEKPSNPPVDEGYIFDGWYTDRECTQPWKYGVATGDTDVYAKWIKFPTVTFYLSPESEVYRNVLVNLDDSPNNRIKSLNVSSVTKLLGSEIPEGYEIEGYYADPDYTEKVLVPDLAYIKQDTTVYLKFKKQPVVTFDYQIDGVEGQTVAFNLGDYIDDGDVPDMPAETPEGYEIVGWYTNEDCTQAYNFDVPVTGDMTLYAKWTPKQFTVTFEDGVEGNDVVSSTVSYGEKIDEPPTDPTREGYDFAGWYTDEDCTEVYDFATPVTDNMTLYAKWTPVVDPDPEPTPDPDPEPTPDPDPEPTPDPEPEPTPDPEPEPTPDPDPETKTFSVTLNDGLAGTEDQVITIAEGETIDSSAIKAPTYDGWTFVGWFTDSDLTQEWDFSTPVTSDMTLWAGWLRNDVDGSGVTDDTETTTDDVEKDANKAEKDNDPAVPDTGDATVAVYGIAAVGAALTGAGALIRRRR